MNRFQSADTLAVLRFLDGRKQRAKRERLAVRRGRAAFRVGDDPPVVTTPPPGFYARAVEAADGISWWLHPGNVATYGVDTVARNVTALRGVLFETARQAYVGGATATGDALAVLTSRAGDGIASLGRGAGEAFKAWWGRSPAEQLDLFMLAALGLAGLAFLLAMSPGGQAAIVSYGSGLGIGVGEIGRGAGLGIGQLGAGLGTGTGELLGSMGRGTGAGIERIGAGTGLAIQGLSPGGVALGGAALLPVVPP
jgi:hypothetical protein